MAKRMKRIIRRPVFWIICALALLFALFVNLAGSNLLPDFLQRPIDELNKATGGVLYSRPKPPLEHLSVHFIDVGQGDSIFVYCDGESMLIDGGPGSADGKAYSYLKDYGISELKYIVATHPHEDHIGGLPKVLSNIKTRAVVMPDATTNTGIFSEFLNSIISAGLKATKAVPGDRYALGGAEFTILAPNSNGYEDLNDHSVVIRLVYGQRSFLFAGDCSGPSEADILEKGYSLASDVLKVGHHGSDTSTSDAFLEAVKPSYAVISVGKGNLYGHPSSSVIKKLSQAGVKTFRTDRDGTVIIECDGKNITVETEK